MNQKLDAAQQALIDQAREQEAVWRTKFLEATRIALEAEEKAQEWRERARRWSEEAMQWKTVAEERGQSRRQGGPGLWPCGVFCPVPDVQRRGKGPDTPI